MIHRAVGTAADAFGETVLPAFTETEAGLGHAERAEDVLLHVVRDRHAADDLHHGGEDDDAVAVLEMGPGLKGHRHVHHGADLGAEVVARPELHAADAVVDDGEHLFRGAAVVGVKAHVHIEQVLHQHGYFGVLDGPAAVGLPHADLQMFVLRQESRYGVVHEEDALLELHHAAQGGIGLGDGMDAEDGIRGERLGLCEVAVAEIAFVQHLPAPADGERGAWILPVMNEMLKQLIQIFFRRHSDSLQLIQNNADNAVCFGSEKRGYSFSAINRPVR